MTGSESTDKSLTRSEKSILELLQALSNLPTNIEQAVGIIRRQAILITQENFPEILEQEKESRRSQRDRDLALLARVKEMESGGNVMFEELCHKIVELKNGKIFLTPQQVAFFNGHSRRIAQKTKVPFRLDGDGKTLLVGEPAKIKLE